MEKEFEPMAIYFNETAGRDAVLRALLRVLSEIDTEKRLDLKESRDILLTFAECLA